jgi:hypothetical protein
MDVIARRWCRECRDEVTGSDDGTGLSYCHDCDEAKDDEHVLVLASDSRGAVEARALLDAIRDADDDRRYLPRHLRVKLNDAITALGGQ